MNCTLKEVHYFVSNRREVFADELNPPEPEPLDFRSVTMKDFNKPEFVSKKPVPTKVLHVHVFTSSQVRLVF